MPEVCDRHCLSFSGCVEYDKHNACSAWRQGGARIDFFLLLPNLSSVFFYHLDACSKWRQGGARITELSGFCINEMYGYGTGNCLCDPWTDAKKPGADVMDGAVYGKSIFQ